MSETEAFLSTFDPIPEEARFPSNILAAYAPDSCLANTDGRFVWRVRRQSDGALFVLKSAPLADGDLMEEFCILARLSPLLPNQVPAPIGYFQDNETEYLLRAYLPGITLAQYREQEDGCSPERCIQLGQKLCALLEILHDRQPPVIHRDIKPENILLLPSGEVALIDFSIARQYKVGQDTDTRHMGTRATAAPEQYGYAQTDCRTDIYALGMTLIWLLTGRYDAEALAETAYAPKYLRGVLETAVSFAPESRYQDAASFSAALSGHPIRRERVVSRRKPRPLFLLLILLACLMVGAGFLWRESKTVTFSSETMEAAVRLELDRPEGRITYDDLTRIRHLGAVGDHVFSAGESFEYSESNYRIGDVFYAVDGHTEDGDIADLSLLTHMPNLEELYLCRQAIRDVSALEGLPLVTLALNENSISDFTPLASLTGLQTLYLSGNPATDYSPLARLTNLRQLALGGATDSLAFLEPLALRELALGELTVSDGSWQPLTSQNKLATLELWNPPAEAMDATSALSGLRELRLCDYAHRDLTPLFGMGGLESLIVSDLESLEGAEALTGLRQLRLWDSVVSDFSPLSALKKLRSLQLHNLPNADYTTIPEDSTLTEIRVDETQMAAVETACPGHAFLILPF